MSEQTFYQHAENLIKLKSYQAAKSSTNLEI